MRSVHVEKTAKGEHIYTSKTLNGETKGYVVDTLKGIRDPLRVDKPFEPKHEYSRLKFDPNIRHVPMEMPNSLTYRYLYGIIPDRPP
jgi:hypothetical protein